MHAKYRFHPLFHGLLVLFLVLSCTQSSTLQPVKPSTATLQATDFKLLQAQPAPERPTQFQAQFSDHTGTHEAIGVMQQVPNPQSATEPDKPFATQTINNVEGLVTTIGSRHGTQTLHYRVQLEKRSGLLQPAWLHFAFQGPSNSASCFNTNGYVYRAIQFPASGTLQLDITLTLPYWFIQNGSYDVKISEHHESYNPTNPTASQLSMYEAMPFIVDNHQNFTLTGNQTTADVSQGQALSIAIDYTSGDAFDGYFAGPLGAEAPMDEAFAHCGRDIAGFNWAPPANLAPGTYEI